MVYGYRFLKNMQLFVKVLSDITAMQNVSVAGLLSELLHCAAAAEPHILLHQTVQLLHAAVMCFNCTSKAILKRVCVGGGMHICAHTPCQWLKILNLEFH
jgi:hypothetical protein